MYSFSALICYYIVSSADNLLKQLGHRSGPAKLFLRKCAFIWSHMCQIRCWRGKCFIFLSAHFLSLIICLLLVVILIFYNSECFCRNALMCSLIYSLLCSRVKCYIFFFQRPFVRFSLSSFFPKHLAISVSNNCFIA